VSHLFLYDIDIIVCGMFSRTKWKIL